jgi:2-oxoglutarate ferredoxin oxidoreductase subunit alpha
MKKILNGNEAFAYGALAAGIDFYAGYPITPSTDVYEFFENHGAEYGVKFVHASSEVSAVNMIMGASIAGARALTVTSGCGFSLMQEAISYMAGDFVPCVILNVMREGAGLGDIPRSQGDYNQMTKGGGNGDYHAIVLVANSVRDCMNIPKLAYELSEKYQNPVIVTYDSDIAHTKENVEILEQSKNNIDKLGFTLSGNKSGKPKLIQNVYYHDKDYNNTLKNKYELIEENEQRYEEYETDDAEIVLVAYSICARICKDVVKRARGMGLKVGLIVPITLYPFPKKAFEKLGSCKKIITVELNILKQMRRDVEYFTKQKYGYYSINSMSTCPSVLDILNYIEEIK